MNLSNQQKILLSRFVFYMKLYNFIGMPIAILAWSALISCWDTNIITCSINISPHVLAIAIQLGSHGHLVRAALGLSRKTWTPVFSFPQSKYIKIFGLPDNLFLFYWNFWTPAQKFLIYLGLSKCFIPLNLHWIHCVNGDNLFHLKYLILQLYIYNIYIKPHNYNYKIYGYS